MKKFIEQIKTEVEREHTLQQTRVFKFLCGQYGMRYSWHESVVTKQPFIIFMYSFLDHKRATAQLVLDGLHSWYGYIDVKHKNDVIYPNDLVTFFTVPDIKVRYDKDDRISSITMCQPDKMK